MEYFKEVHVVDDEPTNRMFMREIVKHIGKKYELELKIYEHENGKEIADRVLNGAKEGVIIMDILMPVLNGVQAAEAIRQHEINSKGNSKYRILSWGANYQELIDENFIKPETKNLFDGHIPKPVDAVTAMTSIYARLLK